MRSSKQPGDSSVTRDITDDLNRLMAEEVEACLRYFQLRLRLRDRDYAAAQAFFEEAIKETMEHAMAIAQQIRSRGETPTLRVNLTLGGGPVRLEATLAEALEVEQQALDAYTDLLPRVLDDPALADFIRSQVEVETEHVRAIREFAEAKSTMKLVTPPKTNC
ncbi:MAG TPA: ferritin-like domain-containing protein [Vicinamibacterales bacterium]|nr:ferritin-like domain-containing protein [Vicinamibacterales bacterium]